ncbi:hypothetical protein NPN19_24165, partial [Vibrio parahaemolyticus]|uniref:hypothetical protein n=1 Tax=Vibrio parahaemolyticus TaxID=670 RepID=UPI00211301A1
LVYIDRLYPYRCSIYCAIVGNPRQYTTSAIQWMPKPPALRDIALSSIHNRIVKNGRRFSLPYMEH